MEHFTRHTIVKGSQRGFSEGQSRLTNMLGFLEKVYTNLDEAKTVDVIYCINILLKVS